MTEKSSATSSYSKIVEALVPNPSEVPDVRAFVGMLGRSNRPNHSRLYLTIDLCDYLEVADEDIMVSIDIKSSALGANVVWIKRDAKFVRTRLETAEHNQDSDGWKRIDLSYSSPGCRFLVDKVHL